MSEVYAGELEETIETWAEVRGEDHPWGRFVNVRPHVHHPWSGDLHHLECS